MKGCVVMAAHAIDVARRHGLDGLGAVEVLLVPDEELGSPGSRAWIEERARLADACLGLEAGWPGGGVVVARGAVGALYVTAHGRTAHCAAPGPPHSISFPQLLVPHVPSGKSSPNSTVSWTVFPCEFRL